MWFIEQGSNQIASISRSPTSSHTYPIPTSAAYANSLTEGPDGNIYFTEERVGQIGILDPATGSYPGDPDADHELRPLWDRRPDRTATSGSPSSGPPRSA